jgi:DNA-binding HxlR family transcriptional regulator
VGLPFSESHHHLDQAGEAIDLLCRRGLLPVLGELSRHTLRHNELARGTGLDSKQLSRALRHALSANLIDRNVSGSQMPVCVYYQLTKRGEELISALGPLAAWYGTYQEPPTSATQP